MSLPPPLPKPAALKEPLQYAHFESVRSGLFTPQLDRDRIEHARKQALEWIHAHPELEIVSVDSTFGRMMAIITVWYR